MCPTRYFSHTHSHFDSSIQMSRHLSVSFCNSMQLSFVVVSYYIHSLTNLPHNTDRLVFLTHVAPFALQKFVGLYRFPVECTCVLFEKPLYLSPVCHSLLLSPHMMLRTAVSSRMHSSTLLHKQHKILHGKLLTANHCCSYLALTRHRSVSLSNMEPSHIRA